MKVLHCFLINIATVILFGSLGSFVALKFSRKYMPWMWGVLFGLLAVLSMEVNIFIASGHFVDLRHVIMTLGGYVGGLPTAIIAALITGLYCYLQSGPGALGGIITVFILGLIGSWLQKRHLHTGKNGNSLYWCATGLILTIITQIIIYLTHPGQHRIWVLLKEISVPLLILTPIATVILFKIFFLLHGILQKLSLLDTVFSNPSIKIIVFNIRGNTIWASKNLANDALLSKYVTNPLAALPDEIAEKVRLNPRFLQNDFRKIEVNIDRADLYSLILTPIMLWEGEPVFLMIFSDITREKQLEKLRNRIASIVKYSDDAIISFDVQGKIDSWNQGAEKIFGYSAEEIIGNHISNIVPNELYHQTFDQLDKVERGEEIAYLETIRERKDSSKVDVSLKVHALRDETGKITGGSAIIRELTDRKILEEALRKSHRQVVNILESITNSFYALDKNWCFTYINEAASFMVLYKKQEDLIGKNIWEVFPHLVGTELYCKLHQVVAKKESVQFETRGIKHNCWFELHCYPIEDGVSVYINDITEQKLAREATQRLAAIVENSEDAIITMTSEGVISSWNKGATKLYGYFPKEVVGEPVGIIIPQELKKELKQKLEALRHGKTFENDRTIRVHKNGDYIHVSAKSSLIKDADGKVIESSSIHRDISERVKFEEELAAERELLMVTLNSLNEGVVATNPEGQIILINNAAAQLIGINPAEAIGHPITEIFYVIEDKTSEPVKFIPGEIVSNSILVSRDLLEIPVASNSSYIKAPEGTVFGVVTVIQDITEKIQTQQELLRADKLESLGILAGGIAHDFNNVLAAILANIQLASLKLNKHEDIADYLLNTARDHS